MKEDKKEDNQIQVKYSTTIYIYIYKCWVKGRRHRRWRSEDDDNNKVEEKKETEEKE